MELVLIFAKLMLFKLRYFGSFLHSRVWSLCNQLLLQFSMDASQTLQTYCAHITDVHVGFDGDRLNLLMT